MGGTGCIEWYNKIVLLSLYRPPEKIYNDPQVQVRGLAKSAQTWTEPDPGQTNQDKVNETQV